MYHHKPVERLAGSVVLGSDPTDLRAILDPSCALAIWDRSLSPVTRDLSSTFDHDGIDDIDDIDAVILSADAVVQSAVLLGAAGYNVAVATALATEIGIMSDCLCLVMPAKELRLRLEVVETDACRRFHADMVAMRLLVTLRGPGTQWIEVATPETIEQVPTGAVALFKGRLLHDDPIVLHRSPPISGTGQFRLVLVIDPA